MWPAGPTEKIDHATAEFDGAFAESVDIRALNTLALGSLGQLFDKNEGMFSGRVTFADGTYRRDAGSLKRTAIALLGLRRLAESGVVLPFDVAAMEEAVSENPHWVKCLGDLGLFTWFTAECLAGRLPRLLEQFNFQESLSQFADGREARTTALAWFLAGLSHATLARPELNGSLMDVAADTYRLLLDNQGEDGIFGHASSAKFPRNALYSRFGTFTDQIFSIYALSLFSRAFEIDEPLEPALACANALCAQQGESGQWWFLYDKWTSRVAKRYPVETRHQGGTAAIGLLALEKVTARSFQKAIAKGMTWLAGGNELNSNFCRGDRKLMWDSIGHNSGVRSYWDAALCLFKPLRGNPASGLGIRYEARPDHSGWLLYAFGGYGLANEMKPLALGKHA